MPNSKSTSRNTPMADQSTLHRNLITELKKVKRSLGRTPSDEILSRALKQAKTVQVKMGMAATLLIPFEHEPKLALLTDLVNRAHIAKPTDAADGADHGYPAGTAKYLWEILDTAIAELSQADLLLHVVNLVAAKLGYALDVIHHARICEALNRCQVEPLALTVISDLAMRWNANVGLAAETFLDCLWPTTPPAHA